MLASEVAEGRRPNVIVIVLDDLGFAQLGCYGGPIETPNIDDLAAQGLRYNGFHVTSLCSPTRAALLTGRNHHRVGMGSVAERSSGSPGYTARIPASAGTLPRILRDVGFNTFGSGKWHLAPVSDITASGPFDRWPLGQGFERYYGFNAGETNQWTPELFSDNGYLGRPHGRDEEYHLTEDLADQAIRFIKDQQHATPGKPFFLYLAPGAVHAPHHAPRSHIDRYSGHFDQGWEVVRQQAYERQLEMGLIPDGTALTERPEWVQPWSDFDAREKRFLARLMEAFAGFTTHADEQIGRVIDFVREIGMLDDTLVLLLSDNGASAEGGPIGALNYHPIWGHLDEVPENSSEQLSSIGGPDSFNHYSWSWAWAGNTPFRLWKRFAWLGGVRTPLVARWPGAISDPGSIRSQFCHAVDVLPTVLEACGVVAPEQIDGVDQMSFDGKSFAPSFEDDAADCSREVQYFEVRGSRSIYVTGWKATTNHKPATPFIENRLVSGSTIYSEDSWSLYDLGQDFSEAEDVSSGNPERLQQMIEVWWAEAGRNNVLPLADDNTASIVGPNRPMWSPPGRSVYRAGGGPISQVALASLREGFSLAATFEGVGVANGVICSLGDRNQGWALYLKGGVPIVAVSIAGQVWRLEGPGAAGSGRHVVTWRYVRQGEMGGTFSLTVDDQVPATVDLPVDLPMMWQTNQAGMYIGRSAGGAIVDDYAPPFEFDATIHAVVIDVEDPMWSPSDGELDALAFRHE